MHNATQILNRLIEDREAQDGREASVDFTVNGTEFTISVVDNWVTLWYDDAPQENDFFSTYPDDIERLTEWLNDSIGEAIQ